MCESHEIGAINMLCLWRTSMYAALSRAVSRAEPPPVPRRRPTCKYSTKAGVPSASLKYLPMSKSAKAGKVLGMPGRLCTSRPLICPKPRAFNTCQHTACTRLSKGILTSAAVISCSKPVQGKARTYALRDMDTVQIGQVSCGWQDAVLLIGRPCPPGCSQQKTC